MLRKRFVVSIVVAAFSTLCSAQKADVSFVAGASFTTDAQVLENGTCLSGCIPIETFKTNHHIFFEGTGAVRLADLRLASLYLEVPVAVIPSAQINASNTLGGSFNFLSLSTLFVTPSLRIKLAPAFPISPFASIGGGWAHYSISSIKRNNFAALQFGGGMDIKTGIPLLGIRAEVRDFMTPQPNFGDATLLPPGSSGIASRRHNVLAGGGIVLRF
jgi:hypothetical protein